MDPSADPFTPDHEYEIPFNWGRQAAQQSKVRGSSAASVPASEDYSDLPPVIHRFQKPPIDSSDTSRKGSKPSRSESNRPIAPSLLDVDPEFQYATVEYKSSTVADDHLTSAPFPMVSPTNLSKPQTQSFPQKVIRPIKSSKNNDLCETTGEGSCKRYVRKEVTRQLRLLLHSLVIIPVLWSFPFYLFCKSYFPLRNYTNFHVLFSVPITRLIAF